MLQIFGEFAEKLSYRTTSSSCFYTYLAIQIQQEITRQHWIKQISCSMFLITLVSLISVSLVASQRVFSLFVKSKKISDLSTKSLFKKDCFYFFQNSITFKKLSMNKIHYYWRLIWYFLHKYANFFQQRVNRWYTFII